MKRSRNWILTNNYKDRQPLTSEEFTALIHLLTSISFYAFQLEAGENETPHHQAYLHFSQPLSFNALKQVFPTAHIEAMRGSPQDSMMYCTKHDTRLEEPIIWGELPQQGKRNDLEEIYELIKGGISNKEIREQYPGQYIRYQDKLKLIRQEIFDEKYSKMYRHLEVIYISDQPGVGKTRFVMEKYGYENVFRVSNYKNPFDHYDGQEVIIFEEFRDSLPIEQMLNYLDGYPLRLPARYSDRVACYKTVFIISNWNYENQYKDIQRHNRSTFEAFRRRFTMIGSLKEVINYFNTKEGLMSDET